MLEQPSRIQLAPIAADDGTWRVAVQAEDGKFAVYQFDHDALIEDPSIALSAEAFRKAHSHWIVPELRLELTRELTDRRFRLDDGERRQQLGFVLQHHLGDPHHTHFKLELRHDEEKLVWGMISIMLASGRKTGIWVPLTMRDRLKEGQLIRVEWVSLVHGDDEMALATAIEAVRMPGPSWHTHHRIPSWVDVAIVRKRRHSFKEHSERAYLRMQLSSLDANQVDRAVQRLTEEARILGCKIVGPILRRSKQPEQAMNPQHRLFRRDLELERVDDDFIGKLARVEIPAVVEIDMQMLERPEPLL